MFRIKRACARAHVKNGSREKKRNALSSALVYPRDRVGPTLESYRVIVRARSKMSRNHCAMSNTSIGISSIFFSLQHERVRVTQKFSSPQVGFISIAIRRPLTIARRDNSNYISDESHRRKNRYLDAAASGFQFPKRRVTLPD